ncbi:hypothetical protein MAJHIDBO_02213 [Propionibacterium freudenreichii subsp. shermanii]|nr:hypothetical protein MAJHIDBO_02213 [Propionibacterium freudenreichii subsp. shermanii]SPS09994.1 hypothetical protein MAJHIDBO_02213 [Propionibacterium freudenreichii subsp. shermanii]
MVPAPLPTSSRLMPPRSNGNKYPAEFRAVRARCEASTLGA